MVLMEGNKGEKQGGMHKGARLARQCTKSQYVGQPPVPSPTAAGRQVGRQHIAAAVVMEPARIRLQLASFCLLAATVAACCGGCASTAPANPFPPAAQLGSAAHCASGKAAATWCTSGPTGLGGS